ncbi:MAG: Neogenin, partial [Acidobacteria bacterium]
MLMAGGSLAGSIDTTPPTIAVVATPAANANGWNRTNVTVKFVCSDAESGIKTCPKAQVITTEGANQTISGTATDKSGNTATASITLNIDRTAPVMNATRSPDANAEGWVNGPVVVSFSATDALSGLAPGRLTAPITYSTTGKLTAVGHATDLAGNVGTVKLAGINIDTRNPSIRITLSPAPSGPGYRNAP